MEILRRGALFSHAFVFLYSAVQQVVKSYVHGPNFPISLSFTISLSSLPPSISFSPCVLGAINGQHTTTFTAKNTH